MKWERAHTNQKPWEVFTQDWHWEEGEVVVDTNAKIKIKFKLINDSDTIHQVGCTCFSHLSTA
jgi:hypothetical protein